MFIAALFEWLLYICFSFLTGSLFISQKRRVFPKKFVLFAVAGSALFSSVPLAADTISISRDIGFGTAAKNVFIDFHEGKAWFILVVIAVLLFCLIRFNDLNNDPFLTKIALLLAMLLIGLYAFISLSGGILPWVEYICRFLYMTCFSFLGGLLLTRDPKNHKRRSVTSIMFLLIALVSNFLIMSVNLWNPIHHLFYQFKQSLIVNYGQNSLVLFLLIFIALWHTLMSYFSKKNDRIVTRRTIFLSILAVSAFLDQQIQPHDIEALIKTGNISPLFQIFYHQPVTPSAVIHFTWNGYSVVMLIVSFLFLFLSGVCIIKSWPKWLSVVFSFLFAASAYLTLMISIS
ncbi:hypothetical protein [Scopulibacillus cellulosilyticus]|uniref:Copper resistance protein D n=1 Tax=Scopulibacillus cellulosilyticus TaxID=2665665 RepID=A0ABW2PQX7_9BACL